MFIDPCPGTCGYFAECKVVQHNAYCTCIAQHTGDPFLGCHRIPPPPPVKIEQVDPCYPSPCGPNSECSSVNGAAECHCRSNYIGSPPNCRPECSSNDDCPQHLACVNQKCIDPCPGSCGANAECSVINHRSSCKCLPGYVGDAFTYCYLEPKPVRVEQDPCNPSPCGQNAICSSRQGTGASCTCIKDYHGDPFVACRPECSSNAECPNDKACRNYHCVG